MSDALEFAIVEKLRLLAKKPIPILEACVVPLSCPEVCRVQAPSPRVSGVAGMYRHNCIDVELEQEPAYTDISPSPDIEGAYVVVSLLKHGRLDVTVSKDRFDFDRVVEIFKVTSWCWDRVSELGMKAYATSLRDDDVGGRSMVVGKYGKDRAAVIEQRSKVVQNPIATWLLIFGMISLMNIGMRGYRTASVLDHIIDPNQALLNRSK